jgi:hypothetical protein
MSETNPEPPRLTTCDVSLHRIGEYTITLEEYRAGQTVVGDFTSPLVDPAKPWAGPTPMIDMSDPRLLDNRKGNEMFKSKSFNSLNRHDALN